MEVFAPVDSVDGRSNERDIMKDGFQVLLLSAFYITKCSKIQEVFLIDLHSSLLTLFCN